MTNREQLQRIFGDPLLHPLIRKLENRLARRNDMRGVISLQGLSPEQHDAVMALLGRTASPSPRIRIRLVELEQRIQQSHAAPDLRSAMVCFLRRQLVHPKHKMREQQAAWENLYHPFIQRLDDSSELQLWLKKNCDKGVIRRCANGDIAIARLLLEQLEGGVRQFPLPLPEPLPIFAAKLTGDAHGLDPDRPLGRLLVRAAAVLGKKLHTDTAAGKRDAWGSAGIVQDELSSTVLLLNLHAMGNGLTDRTLQSHLEAGLPCRLTFRHLRLHPPTFHSSLQSVSVCENPSVVAAAADTLGIKCAPLICVEGQPSQAAQVLLSQLVHSGSHLRYHGDFDWPGIAMANGILQMPRARPWRMANEDYLNAPGMGCLEGTRVAASWSEALYASMITRRKIVLEESVVDMLLSDLSV